MQCPGQVFVAALDHDVGDRTLSPYALFQELDLVLDFCVLYLPRGLNETGRLIPKRSGCFCFLLFATGTARGFSRVLKLLVRIAWKQMPAGALGVHNPHLPCNSFLFQFSDLTSMSPTLLDKGTSSPLREVLRGRG